LPKLDTVSEECLKYIINKQIPEAKALVFNIKRWDISKKKLGRRTACNGIIYSLNPRSSKNTLPTDSEKMKRLRRVLYKRIGSLWCDEFEEGFIEGWVRYIDLSINLNPDLNSSTNKRVIENPRE